MDLIHFVSSNVKNGESVHFLMPCHSTPYYSHVHRNITMRFLDCSPSFEPNYVDEADQFKADPALFLSTHYGKVEQHPDYVAIFNKVLPQVSDFFSKYHYREVATFIHTYGFNFSSFIEITSDMILVYSKE